MNKKETLASKYAIVKPTAEEVAFEVFENWFTGLDSPIYDDNFSCKIVECGLVMVNVYKTSCGFLAEIHHSFDLPCMTGWDFNRRLYHLTNWNVRSAENVIPSLPSEVKVTPSLPSDFKRWFIETIDLMYGWNNQ